MKGNVILGNRLLLFGKRAPPDGEEAAVGPCPLVQTVGRLSTYPQQAHAHRAHKYIYTWLATQINTLTLGTHTSPQARSAGSSLVLTHLPVLSLATGTADPRARPP